MSGDERIPITIEAPIVPENQQKMSYEAYKGERNESIKHEFYKAGDECPLDCEGRLYNIEPGIIMRIYGQSEADVVKYEVEKLRCSSCLHVFSADTERHDHSELFDRFDNVESLRAYITVEYERHMGILN